MKKISFIGIAVLLSISYATAQNYKFTEASDLTLTGKIFPDTPNPYHRIDTVRFKGFSKRENYLVRNSSGIACAFKTNSTTITVKTEYGQITFPTNTNGISSRGYDLYIREEGQWLFAGSGVAPDNNNSANVTLVATMDPTWKECLMYLPLYCEVNSVKIGIDENSDIEAMDNPFRHRVAIWGSSFTHGSSTTRAGMTYPALFTRKTGIQLLSLGTSGRCMMQPYFGNALAHAENIDAFIFDSFSNPTAEMIEERLFPFIEQMRAAHPGVPLIFQQTIRRESRNFSNAAEKKESARQSIADSLMRIAVKRYQDVYFIKPDASAPDHNATVDGVHPSNHGYELWEKSIEKPVLRILRKYGIR